MATVNILVTNILHNIFCVQQKKEIHTGLEQLEVESNLNFGAKIPLK